MSAKPAPKQLATGLAILPIAAAGPSFVDITWMSMANRHYQIGSTGVITDGYITRIPQAAFYGGPSGLASTHETYRPDVRSGVELVAPGQFMDQWRFDMSGDAPARQRGCEAGARVLAGC